MAHMVAGRYTSGMHRTKGHEALARHIAHLAKASPPGTPVKKRFADVAGLSKMELSHLLAGRRIPGLAKAVRISDVTAGAVSVRSWTEQADLEPHNVVISHE